MRATGLQISRVFDNLTKSQARGLEQLMIDKFGLKNLENINNSVGMNNKKILHYYTEAVRFLQKYNGIIP
jgi:hypothetical protein